MMSSQILHKGSNLVRVSRILDNIFNNCQNPRRVHSKRVRDTYPVDLYCSKFVEMDQDFGMAIEKFLKFFLYQIILFCFFLFEIIIWSCLFSSFFFVFSLLLSATYFKIALSLIFFHFFFSFSLCFFCLCLFPSFFISLFPYYFLSFFLFFRSLLISFLFFFFYEMLSVFHYFPQFRFTKLSDGKKNQKKFVNLCSFHSFRSY